jgi:hypothetical protein
METLVFDAETLPNYTVLGFKCVETGERFKFRRGDKDAPARLAAFMQEPGVTFVGFNNHFFDNIIVEAFIAGRSELEIKRIADAIISERLNRYTARRRFMLPEVKFDSIDLIEVAPSFVGLKAYGARMHMPLLQDMPLAHDADVTPEQWDMIDEYNVNDIDTTEQLLSTLEKELLLRVQMSRQYGVDMRSKSDSQMAEAAYIATLKPEKQFGAKIPKSVRYTPPAFIKFQDPALQVLFQRVCETEYQINQATGHIIAPEFLTDEVFKFNAGLYQLGSGGIHSKHDVSVCHVANDNYEINDIDAASFYPSIILLCDMYPEALGREFLTNYRQIYNRRLEAKRTGDKVTNETLKISLNGTFGKLASKYSVLYSPELMIATTLTGQFTLLMLIEWLEAAGAVTLSANTDGIAVGNTKDKSALVREVVKKFEQRTGFEFEFTPYRALAMKDVNNYIAVKLDREVKEKGIYAPLSLKKNPTAGVCAKAVGAWLSRGTPFEQTIREAPFTDFISARNVTGGGVQGDEYLGKVVRWYQSSDPSLTPLKYKSNGNKVPKTDGARACMAIESAAVHPADLDYTWYVREAAKIAAVCGAERFLTEEHRALLPIKKTKRKKKDE